MDLRTASLATAGLVVVGIALVLGSRQVGPAAEGAADVRPRRYFFQEPPAAVAQPEPAAPSSTGALARSLQLEQRGDLEGAAREAQAAVIESDGRDARLQAGKIAILRGRLEEAEVWLQPLLAADPSDVVARYDLALVAHQRGDAEKAQAEYAEVLSRKPDHADARYNLAVLHRDSGRTDLARQEAARFAEQHPADARVQPLLRSLASAPAK